MRGLIAILLGIKFVFGFEVYFDDYYKTILYPTTKVILLKPKTYTQIKYEPKIYTKQGIVLLNYDEADQFVRNDLYFDGIIERPNIALLDINEIRSKAIKKLNKSYNKCVLKKIKFKDTPEQNIYFSITTITLHSKVILECK